MEGIGRYRSFTYPQMKQDCIQGKFIHLPQIGAVKLIQHRPLPDGFMIKTATITRKADGWYVTLSLQDSSVPATPENTIGTDEGESVSIPQYYSFSLIMGYSRNIWQINLQKK